MKSVLIALVLLTSFNVFAGPEDHFDLQACYHLSNEQVAAATDGVPKMVCIETLKIGVNGSSVEAFSYFMNSLYKNIQLDYYARHNENGFTFRTSSVLKRDVAANCGAGEAVTLHVNGRADNDNFVEIRDLDITAERLVTADSCLAPVQKTVFTYSK